MASTTCPPVTLEKAGLVRCVWGKADVTLLRLDERIVPLIVWSRRFSM